MKRHLRPILIYLLLGAALNVVVGWGIVVAHGELWMGASPISVTQKGKETFMVRRQLPGHTVIWGVADYVPWNRDPRPDWCPVQERWWPEPLLDRVDRYAVLVASGWPCLSLQAWQIDDRPFEWALVDNPHDERAWLLKTYGQSLPLVVPFRPVVKGFALNSTLYAAAIWCFIAGPRTLRSVLRGRRGLCPRCAYPRENHAICPECGTTHKRRMGKPIAHALPPA